MAESSRYTTATTPSTRYHTEPGDPMSRPLTLAERVERLANRITVAALELELKEITTREFTKRADAIWLEARETGLEPALMTYLESRNTA